MNYLKSLSLYITKEEFMNNEKKCNNYESFFIFKDEETFNNHLKNCPDCRAEHEKYLKVSQLVKEVSDVYLKQEQKNKYSVIKKIACCFIICSGLISFTGYQVYNNSYISDNSDISYISVMGLPTDDYGFLDLI